MKHTRLLFMTVAAVVLCMGVPAWGAIVNGGFETGDLTGWTFTGAGPIGMPAGTPGAVTQEMSREILGLPQPPGGPFWTPLPNGGTYFASLWSSSLASGSSSLSQTFVASGGLPLVFDYFFDTEFQPGNPGFIPDSAWATLTLPDSSTVTLLDYNRLSGILLGNDVNIGWTHVSYPLTQAGSYTLTFSMLDGNGPMGSESILGVDNVTVIPAPAAVLLGAIGLGTAGWVRRRFG